MRLPVLLLLPFALASCESEPADEQPAGSPPANVAVPVDVAPIALRSEDPAALKAAFAAAFDTPDQRLDDDLYRFAPAALYRIGDQWVLLSEGRGPDCHACSGWLGVHYLARSPAGFTLRGGRPDAIPGSGYGGPPEWRMRTDLTSAPLIQSEASDMGQGISCRVARLTELAPGGPEVSAERIPLDYSNAGTIVDGTAATEVHGAIAAAEGARDQGFVVHYTGTTTRDVPYRRAGDTYAPGADAASVPQC